jgi:signal transduction histidine kinase/ActR/RegA family two-component response regulator
MEADEVEALRQRVRQLESEVSEQRAGLRALIESLPFDFWMIGSDGRYAVQNETSRRHWGDAVGRRPEDFMLDESVREIWSENNRKAFAGETVRGEVTYVFQGEARHFINVLAPIVDGGTVRGIVGVNIDVTDTRRLDEQNQRVQRIESLGVLAGGLAHDFNNLLMAILGNIDLARRSIAPDTHTAELLEEARRVCREARELTQQLLTFSRGGEPVRVLAHLGDVVREAALFAARGSSCRCEVACDDALWFASADVAQIRQVVQNLVLNAVQAMPGGGVVRVRVRNAVVEEAATSSSGPLPGRYVEIQVSDDGVGIAAGDLPRIFDPYFTTKESGHGLGLAVVHSVVRKHGGSIHVRSQVGVGTTFDVLVPANDGVRSEPPPALPDRVTVPRARVLVLDDDPVIRRVLARLLRSDGYDVEGAEDAAEAMTAFRRARDAGRPFSVVVLDLTLRGGPGGVACLQELRRMDPGVAAVAASGYSDAPVVAEPERHGFGASLAKPFTRDELVAAIEKAVAGARR